MSKTIKIPEIGPNPYVVELGGIKYSYAAGATVTVPDAVAAIIANDLALRPKEDPAVDDKMFATVEKVKALIAASGGGGDGGFTVVYDGETVDKTPEEILEAAASQKVTLVVTGEDGDAEQYMLIEAGTDKDDTAYAEFARVYETKDGARMEIYTYDDDGLDSKVIALALATDIPESPEVRVPFALTVDAQSGTLSASTDADLAETCAAVSAGKLVWADVIVNGDGGKSYYRGIISGDVTESGTGNKLNVAVVDTVSGGANLGVYRIKWDANGCIPTVYTLTTT